MSKKGGTFKLLWLTFFLIIPIFSVHAEIAIDSTAISMHLKPKQVTGIYYYDYNYENKRLIFQNLSDTAAVITLKVFLNKPTEFRHSALRHISGKRIEIDQHFYLEAGSRSSWILKDNYELISAGDTIKDDFIESLNIPGVDNLRVDMQSKTKEEFQDYLSDLKTGYTKRIDRLNNKEGITSKQKEYWQMVFECRYFYQFFNGVNQNPDFQVSVKREIDSEISNFKSRVVFFQRLRFDGAMNASLSLLHLVSERDYITHFDKATDFALENLDELAVPGLLNIMVMIPEIGNDKYKTSIERIKKYATPVQLKYVEILTNNNIDSQEKYVLNTINKGSSRTLKNILDENKGKLIFLDFWASWCVPCRVEIPALKKIEEKYKDKKISFISVSLDKDDKIEEWITALKAEKLFAQPGQYRLVSPDSSKLLQIINLKSVPKYVLLDREGKILNKNFPRPSDNDFERELDRYLKSF